MASNLQLPPGMTDLNTIFENAKDPSARRSMPSLVGVVVDVQTPTKTRNDWMITFKLRDLSVDDNPYVGEGVVVRAFNPREEMLPKISKPGDVILIRRPILGMYSGTPIINPTREAVIIVFPNDSIPAPHFIDAYSDEKTLPHESNPKGHFDSEPTRDEQLYAIRLHAAVNFSTNRTTVSIPATPAVSTQPTPATEVAKAPPSWRDDKWRQLKDVADYQFCNLVCEVVKVYGSDRNVELYVTDYTENPLFFNYQNEEVEDEEDERDPIGRDGDPFGYASSGKSKKRKWQGPPGKMTMQIKMWPPNDLFAAHKVEEGSIWYFMNVRVKHNLGSNILEGNLHGDKIYPSRINIRAVAPSDERVARLKARKKALDQHTSTTPFTLAAPRADDDQENASALKKKKRNQKKKAKKQMQMRDQESSQAAAATPSNGGDSAAQIKRKKVIYNPRVKCRYPDHPPISLRSALRNPNLSFPSSSGLIELPFLNQRFRARVRAVDFDPPDIADFAQPALDFDTDSDKMDVDSPVSPPEKWQWLFRLRVEDAMPPPDQPPARMTLLVAGSEAEYLLNLNPTDLRRDKDQLVALRNSLWTLWGDLEELKGKGQLAVEGGDEMSKQKASSLPFDCCIQEYGQPVHGGDVHDYIRCFQVFGTTIQFDESDEEET